MPEDRQRRRLDNVLLLWGGQQLLAPVLQLYLKVAIFQPELCPRTTFALKSCNFCLEKFLRTRRGSTRDRATPRVAAQTMRQLPKTTSQSKYAWCHGESDPRRGSREHITDPRRGFILECQNRPQFFDLDHTNLQTGLIDQKS